MGFPGGPLDCESYRQKFGGSVLDRHMSHVTEMIPSRNSWIIFFCRVGCADYFGVHSTPILPQWHVKDHSLSAKSAGGRLQLNTQTPDPADQSGLTAVCPGREWQPIIVQAWSGNPSLSRHRVGTHHCPDRVGTHHCPGIEWEPITVQA